MSCLPVGLEALLKKNPRHILHVLSFIKRNLEFIIAVSNMLFLGFRSCAIGLLGNQVQPDHTFSCREFAICIYNTSLDSAASGELADGQRRPASTC